jgi:hypothetical protein
MKGNRGINKLANIIEERMSAHAEKAGAPQLELGSIVGGLGLKLDSTPDIIIPKTEYMVSEWLTFDLGYPFERTLDDGEEHEEFKSGLHDETTEIGYTIPDHSPVLHFHEVIQQGPHKHHIKLPTRLYPIMPGDRVLVAWANRTPVIMTKVVRFHNLGIS